MIQATPKIPKVELQIVSYLTVSDERALELIYQYYADALYGVIHKVVKDDDIASDVFQQSLVKIWQNGQNYNAAKGRLFTWMLNICRNTAIDMVRSKSFRNQQKNLTTDNYVSAIDREYSGSFNPDIIKIKETVDKIKPDYKVLIELAYFEGYTQAEMAERLNLPLGTVKTRVRAAIKELRNLLSEK